MKKMRIWLPFLTLALALIVSACAPATPAANETAPVPETGFDVTPINETELRDEINRFLAETVGVTTDQVEILSISDVVWQDSCLGLGGINESCLQAETPGYQVTASIGEQLYTIRTNADASAIRLDMPEDLEDGPDAVILPDQVLDSALAYLSDQTGVPLDQVQLGAVTAEDWPDACLGLSQPDETCAQVITPGYSITFNVAEQAYEVRTDANASVIRFQEVD